MSAAYPDPTTSDVIKTWLTGLKNHLVGVLNNFNGANIRAGSVPRTALQAPNALFALPLYYQGNIASGAASITNVFGTIRLPNINSSSGSWVLKSWSVGHRTGTPQTGNSLLVKKNGGTEVTVDIGAIVAGTGNYGDQSVTFTTGDELEIDYTYNNPGTPPVYTDITLVLFFQAVHTP